MKGALRGPQVLPRGKVVARRSWRGKWPKRSTGINIGAPPGTRGFLSCLALISPLIINYSSYPYISLVPHISSFVFLFLWLSSSWNDYSILRMTVDWNSSNRGWINVFSLLSQYSINEYEPMRIPPEDGTCAYALAIGLWKVDWTTTATKLNFQS